MNSKIILSACAILLTIGLRSQSPNINKFDSQGKKEGKWIVYLNKDWKKLPDSAGAVYYRYTFYDQGQNIYPMGTCGGKGYKLETKAESNVPGTKIQELDGEYKWYNAKGKLSSVHMLSKGMYFSCKEYYPNGQVHQFFDFTHKCENQEQGWYLYVYDKNGNLKLVSPTCKDKAGHWPTMRD